MCIGRRYLKEAYHAIFQNDFQKAIKAFKNAIHCEPKNASYHHKLSITYSRNGDMKEAIETAKKACEYQPQNQTYRYHLQILNAKNLVLSAMEHMKKDITTLEIEELLQQAKQLDPLNLEAYLLLGIYYGENHHIEKALKEFNYIFKIEPYHEQAKQLKIYYIRLFQEGG